MRRHPNWLKVKIPGGENFAKMKHLLRDAKLHTICEEAKCPNIAECFQCGTAVFLILGDAYLCAERYNEAAVEYNKALEYSPNFLLACLGLTACHSLLGHEKEAADTAIKVRDIDPKFSLDFLERGLPYKEQADIERFVVALRKAGLK